MHTDRTFACSKFIAEAVSRYSTIRGNFLAMEGSLLRKRSLWIEKDGVQQILKKMAMYTCARVLERKNNWLRIGYIYHLASIWYRRRLYLCKFIANPTLTRNRATLNCGLGSIRQPNLDKAHRWMRTDPIHSSKILLSHPTAQYLISNLFESNRKEE